ncbi:MAG: S-adenosylmethionine decarboxylase proenzyme [Deltaproteobacteria bacterium]|nr:S-adenosylmethionine decarboxylase proenzyme [Deltaproteobacteria bacterium]
MKALGRHILTEFYNCDRVLLNNFSEIKKIMTKAAKKSGATVLETVFHLFNPHGISGVVVIAESHLAIHTWPEYGYAAVDLFTCGDDVDPWVAFDFLKKELKAQYSSAMEMKRGQLEEVDSVIKHKPDI